MKFKGFWYDSLIICLVAGISAIFIAFTAFSDEAKLAIAECIAFLVVGAVFIYRAVTAKKRYKSMFFFIKITLLYLITKHQRIFLP